MKALKFVCMLLLVILTVTACQKDDLVFNDEMIELRTPDDPKMVPLKARWSTQPDYSAPLVTVYYEGQPVGQTAGRYVYTDANVSHLGELDSDLSFSTIEFCTVLDLNGPVLEFEQLVTWVNYEGDGLTFGGSSVLTAPEYGGEANWTITGGFGKFENASGWLEATSEGTGTGATADGMVTQPNH